MANPLSAHEKEQNRRFYDQMEAPPVGTMARRAWDARRSAGLYPTQDMKALPFERRSEIQFDRGAARDTDRAVDIARSNRLNRAFPPQPDAGDDIPGGRSVSGMNQSEFRPNRLYYDGQRGVHPAMLGPNVTARAWLNFAPNMQGAMTQMSRVNAANQQASLTNKSIFGEVLANYLGPVQMAGLKYGAERQRNNILAGLLSGLGGIGGGLGALSGISTDLDSIKSPRYSSNIGQGINFRPRLKSIGGRGGGRGRAHQLLQ